MPPETPYDLPNGDRVLVIDTQTAAHNLPLMLQRFRSGQSEPLFFGDEGRPEGVVISFDQWQQSADSGSAIPTSMRTCVCAEIKLPVVEEFNRQGRR